MAAALQYYLVLRADTTVRFQLVGNTNKLRYIKYFLSIYSFTVSQAVGIFFPKIYR